MHVFSVGWAKEKTPREHSRGLVFWHPYQVKLVCHTTTPTDYPMLGRIRGDSCDCSRRRTVIHFSTFCVICQVWIFRSRVMSRFWDFTRRPRRSGRSTKAHQGRAGGKASLGKNQAEPLSTPFLLAATTDPKRHTQQHARAPLPPAGDGRGQTNQLAATTDPKRHTTN